MIQITINNDKEVEVKTTNGLKETEVATKTVVEIMHRLEQTEEPKYKLVLIWVNTEFILRAVKEVKDNMNFDLKEAKDCVDSYKKGHESILASGSKKEVLRFAAKFNNSDCTKVEMRKV